MKKRGLVFLLTVALAVGCLSGQAYAEPASMTEAGAVYEDEVSKEILRVGGLQQQEYHELTPEEMPEVFKEEDIVGKRSAIYRSEWDKYSANYYYNQLSEAEQEFWDKLDAMCLSYLTGTENAVKRIGTNEYSTKSVEYNNLSISAASRVAAWFRYSNPQYYFLDLGVYGHGGIVSGTWAYEIFPAFADGAARMRETMQMKSVIDNWMAQINSQADPLSKEKLAHDLICKKMIYDPGYDNPLIQKNPYNQVAYSVFCTDSTVCAGYSQAMQLLMNGAGIDCAIVTSDEHEWNIIRLADTWYYVDCTWDDNIADARGLDSVYYYFNRSQQIFVYDAMLGNPQHIAESMWNGYLPPLVFDSGANGIDIGTIFMPDFTLAAPQIFCTGSKAVFAAPSGGTIYYTVNGTDPSVAFTKARKYTGEIPLYGTTTLRAIAVASGCYDSSVTSMTVVPHYTVVFYANGGYVGLPGTAFDTRDGLLYNMDISVAQNAKRKGYVFLGWYTDAFGGTKVEGTVKVTADRTYYAQWAKIKSRKAAISSVKNRSKKSMQIKIKRIESASGYQIRYSLKKSMASAKKTESIGNTCTVKKLKKGKTYYVQARIYQIDSVSGKKKYGSWSKAKSVKIKK